MIRFSMNNCSEVKKEVLASPSSNHFALAFSCHRVLSLNNNSLRSCWAYRSICKRVLNVSFTISDVRLEIAKVITVPLLKSYFGRFDFGHKKGKSGKRQILIPCILNDSAHRNISDPHSFKSKRFRSR